MENGNPQTTPRTDEILNFQIADVDPRRPLNQLYNNQKIDKRFCQSLNNTQEIFCPHPLPLGMHSRDVVQELINGPDDSLWASGTGVDNGELVVRLQVVAPHVLSVLLLVAAQGAHEGATSGVNHLLSYVLVIG